MAGRVFYEGPSRIDGRPIVGIAIDRSTNRKTGPMIQTYFLRADMPPMEASRTGADKSICGGCPHRGTANAEKTSGGADNRTCYVTLAHGPGSVYRTWKAGGYPAGTPEDAGGMAAGGYIRLGTYGDPASVPVSVLAGLTGQAKGWTGYTHQWKARKFQDVLQYCQASVDSLKEFALAQALGAGTFRVRSPDQPAMAGEIVCPASEEAGKVTTCQDCRLCDGAKGATVTIVAHGTGARNFGATRALPVLT